MKRTLLLILALTGLALVVTSAQAAEVSTTFAMPVRLQAAVQASGCENSPGPQITLDGALALGGIGSNLIFRNNVKGTHTDTVESDSSVVLVPAGQSIAIPKQPVDGGVGGNPWIWVQMTSAAGDAITAPIFLGRCVQGLSALAADFTLPSTATADVTADGCYNNPGPNVTLGGALALTGLNARFMFANSDNPVGGPHQANVESKADLVVIPAGQSITIPKQPVLGGVGGNPWISLQFMSGTGAAIGDEFLLGRCVQLSQ